MHNHLAMVHIFSYFIAPPLPSSINIIRVNETSYNLRVGVAYTGGGAITHFTVSFRQLGLNTGFTLLSEIPASPTSPESVLEWNGVATSEAFRNAGPLEFQVTLFNTEDLQRTIPPTTETTSKSQSTIVIAFTHKV